MSRINIRRAIENIGPQTNVYTPIVEIIVNAIQAIDEQNNGNGRIEVKVVRKGEFDVLDELPEITGFIIQDNGIGFTNTHRDAFDTLYTDHRIEEGGKGFGRFICLKYFRDLKVDSVYFDGNKYVSRTFKMGKSHDIIVDENKKSSKETSSRTHVTLSGFKNISSFDKKLRTIAKNLIENLLPYFITESYKCPEIVLLEHDGSKKILLNDLVETEKFKFIQEISVDPDHFSLKAHDTDEEFKTRVFKVYSSKRPKSQINLVAHNRTVTSVALEIYIPEFAEEFYDDEKDTDQKSVDGKNFIIRAYTFGSYLDRNVSLERATFNFKKDNDLMYGISREQIERESARIAESGVGSDIQLRKDRKRKYVHDYVKQDAPWHAEILHEIDLSDLPLKPKDQQIENYLQQQKIDQEFKIKHKVKNILSRDSLVDAEKDVIEIVDKISGNSKNDLVHYIAFRRNLLEIFKKSLEQDQSGNYSTEDVVHDIIFPRRRDTDNLPFERHNLWILDERLNFTEYVSSDKPLEKTKSKRPDLLVYNKRVLFRGDNESSNPIIIFEFKRPQRDDFVNPSSSIDPVTQIIRYANDIRDGNITNLQGRNILIADNTPFYGYVVCDLTQKVMKWLETEKDFTPMPDRLGWYRWRQQINLYIEVLSWEKVLRDVQMRNKIFFHKLNIE